MFGQNNGGKMLVKPFNKRLLLEQVKIEEKESTLGFFHLDDKQSRFEEFYRVLDKSDDCAIMIEKGDLISTELVTPVGNVGGKMFFVCHENSVIATIKE